VVFSADAAFAANLKALRSATSTTQAQLAEKMSSRGFKWHAATVYKVENGERQVQLAEALEIARIFDTSIEEIARDNRAEELLGVREQHRNLRQTREHLIRTAWDMHQSAALLAVDLEANDEIRNLLSRDELSAMVGDIETGDALGRSILPLLGQPTPGNDVTYHRGILDITFEAALDHLRSEADRAPEA
jgi:transcriptional regulator with XRE-family HTH domain